MQPGADGPPQRQADGAPEEALQGALASLAQAALFQATSNSGRGPAQAPHSTQQQLQPVAAPWQHEAAYQTVSAPGPSNTQHPQQMSDERHPHGHAAGALPQQPLNPFQAALMQADPAQQARLGSSTSSA